MLICADRRSTEAQPDPEGEGLAALAVAAYLDARLRLARALLRLARNGTFRLSSCSSIVQYAIRLGLPAVEARLVVDLGHALDASDKGITSVPVEDRIRAGVLSVENAALAARVLRQPGASKPGEDWLEKAQRTPTPEFRKLVNERLEQVAQGAPALVAVTVHITERTR